MQIFDIFTILLILLAVFSYVNTCFIKLPATLGFMVGSFVLSLTLIMLQHWDLNLASHAIKVMNSVDFGSTVLYGILSFLLFAGALQLEVSELAKEKWVIFTLATVGVVLSTFIVGTLTYVIFHFFGIYISYIYSLIFGALISPTDPVIVIGLLKGMKIPKSLRMQVFGESLFNDGIAIVLFVILSTMASFDLSVSVDGIAIALVRQVIGGALVGMVLGWLLFFCLSHVTVYSTQVLLTLGFVSGGYDSALYLGISAPIAVVFMGLFLRNYHEKSFAPKEQYRELYAFWGLLDEFLNAGLFLLMGLEVLGMKFSLPFLLAGLSSVVVVLFARFISVWIPIHFFQLFRQFSSNCVKFLTWAGLRGGISLAIALSLPDSYVNQAILTSTYIVVVFSTLIQGLAIRRMLRSSN